MKKYMFTNDDGEVMACVEAKNEEEAMSLYEFSDYFMLEEVDNSEEI